MKELILQIKKYAGYNMILIFISTCSTFLVYFSPLINMKIIDDGILKNNLPLLIQLIALSGLLLIVGKIINMIQIDLETRFGQKIQLSLSQSVLEYFIELNSGQQDNMDSGEMDAIIKMDVQEIKYFVLGLPKTVIVNVFSFAAATIIMLKMQPQMAGLIMLVQLINFVIRIVFNQKIKKNNILERINYAEVNGTINEIIHNVRNIKYIHAKSYVLRTYHEHAVQYNTRQRKNLLTFYIQNNILQIISEFFSLTIMGIGGYMIMEGHLTMGMLTSFIQYSAKFIEPLSALMGITTDLSNKTAQLNKIEHILRNVREMNTHSDDLPKSKTELPRYIQIQNLNFSYADGPRIFEQASALFQAGHRYFLVGRSGVGKSTLAALLMGQYQVSQGEILLNQMDINNIKKEQLCHWITWVPQEPVLFKDSILHNLVLDHDYAEDELHSICKDCAIWDVIQSQDEKFQSIIDEKGGNLSAGQKQRFAIARALLSHTPILIIDEATANLDKETEHIIKNNLIKYTNDKIVIIITHSPDFIMPDSIVYRLENRKLLQIKE